MSSFREKMDAERQAQRVKYGEDTHDDIEWLAIIMDHLGRLSHEVVKMIRITPGKNAALNRAEGMSWTQRQLVRVAAIAEAWYEDMYGRDASNR